MVRGMGRLAHRLLVATTVILPGRYTLLDSDSKPLSAGSLRLARKNGEKIGSSHAGKVLKGEKYDVTKY